MSRRITTLALLGAGGALAAPAGASAATATLDRPCYVASQPGNLALAGFSPNAAVSVANADLGSIKVTTDVTGSLTLPFTPPGGQDLKRPGSRAFAVTATEDAIPANTAAAMSRIAPLAFATSGGTKSPKAPRTWSFSGFTPGKFIHGHFRFRSRTRGNFRFGLATGPCGVYKRQAPGIPVQGRVSTGTWTIQIDQKSTYDKNTKPSLRDTTTVFTTFRPRAVAGAASLSGAALSGFYRFGAFTSGF